LLGPAIRSPFFFGAQGDRLDGLGLRAAVYCVFVSVLLYVLMLVLLVPPSGWAESRTGDGVNGETVAPTTPSSAPSLDLERLLRPPRLAEVPSQRLGGKDRKTWAAEFARVRLEVADLERRIGEAQDRIRKVSPGDWGFAPAGGGAPSDPEVLRLRAELRRDRQSLEAARQRLRDLEVEASLAGVPEGWRQPEN
jgi:hypothetical protein